jgi:pyruvate dehydrogenase E1 component alpha subunit
MNMASLWKLPVLYVCENNQYNEYTHYRETTAGDVTQRPVAFGLETVSINGQDVTGVHTTALGLIERARQGEGPAFLICETYRFHGHHVGDINRAYYRSKQEEEKWRERDPIGLLAGRLKTRKWADDKTLAKIEEELRREIEAGVEFALNAPYPDPAEVDQHVYA